MEGIFSIVPYISVVIFSHKKKVMTVEERVIDIKLKVENAETVRDLKAQSAELVSIIEELGQKTDKTEQEIAQYNDAVELLVNTQNRLTTVMKEGKSQLSAQEGSYNALVNRMAALKKVHKSVSDDFTRNQLSEEIEKINTQLKEMDAKNGVYVRNVGDYENAFKKALKTPQQELKALRIQLAQLEEGTAEYNATFAKMADLTHKVTEQQEMLRWSSADLGDILGNLSGVATSLAGGFSAFNALTGLVGGGESEELEKAMLQAQRFIQLIQGLEQFEQIFDKVKGLWTGIKNFADTTLFGTAALTDFVEETEEVETSSTGAASAINTNAVATNTGAEATERAAAATERYSATISGLTEKQKSMLLLLETQLRATELEIQQYEAVASASGNMDDHIKEQLDSRKESLKTIKAQINAIKQEALTTQAATQATQANTTATELNHKGLKKWLATMILKNKESKLSVAQLNSMTTAQIANTAATIAGASALKIFKTALASTGIGVIIIALGSLLALLGKGLGKVWDWISGANAAKEATNNLNLQIEQLNINLANADAEWSKQERLMKAQGKTAQELYEAEKLVLQAKLDSVRALLQSQQAIAKEIGQRKLQKEKYEDFRKSLEELTEQEKALREELENHNWDEYCRKIEEARKADEDKAKALQKATEEAKANYNKQKEEANKLFKSLIDHYKTEKQKLEEKYKEEKALLEKYGKDTTLLTKKYEEDKTAIVLKEAEARRKKVQEFENTLYKGLEQPSTEYFSVLIKQLETKVKAFSNLNIEVGMGDIDIDPLIDAAKTAEEYKKLLEESPTAMAAWKEGVAKLNKDLELSIDTVDKYILEMRVFDKELRDARKASYEYESDKVVAEIEKEVDAIRGKMDAETEALQLSMALYQSEGGGLWEFTNNYISQMYMRWETEDAMFIQRRQRLEEEIALYKAAAENQNLTEEAKVEALRKAVEAERQLQMESADYTIALNERKAEATYNYVDAVQSSLDGISSILGNVASAWETSIQSQIDSGKISEEEGEKEFEKMKGIQSAITLINTFSSAISAFQSLASIPFVGPALGAAAAAAAIASGMMQVKAINATKIGDKGGSGSSTRYTEVTPTLPTDYSPQMVQNVTGQTETENLANALSKQNIWVSVSDINNTQSRVKTREKESSF